MWVYPVIRHMIREFLIVIQGTPSGTIESVPGYEPSFKAEVAFGADWLSFDPDGKHGRINLKGIAKWVTRHVGPPLWG